MFWKWYEKEMKVPSKELVADLKEVIKWCRIKERPSIYANYEEEILTKELVATMLSYLVEKIEKGEIEGETIFVGSKVGVGIESPRDPIIIDNKKGG